MESFELQLPLLNKARYRAVITEFSEKIELILQVHSDCFQKVWLGLSRCLTHYTTFYGVSRVATAIAVKLDRIVESV